MFLWGEFKACIKKLALLLLTFLRHSGKSLRGPSCPPEPLFNYVSMHAHKCFLWAFAQHRADINMGQIMKVQNTRLPLVCLTYLQSDVQRVDGARWERVFRDVACTQASVSFSLWTLFHVFCSFHNSAAFVECGLEGTETYFPQSHITICSPYSCWLS